MNEKQSDLLTKMDSSLITLFQSQLKLISQAIKNEFMKSFSLEISDTEANRNFSSITLRLKDELLEKQFKSQVYFCTFSFLEENTIYHRKYKFFTNSGNN